MICVHSCHRVPKAWATIMALKLRALMSSREADPSLLAVVTGEKVFVMYDIHFIGAHFCTT